MLPLRQCLLDTYLVRLRAIARFWAIELTAKRQREAASELAEAMGRPQAVAEAWEHLPPEWREALRALLAADGQMPQRVFTRQWGEIRAMGPGRMEREKPWREPVSPAEGLWYAGFVFSTFAQAPEGAQSGAPSGAYEAAFVPPELRALLPASGPDRPTITLEPSSAPAAVLSDRDHLLDDACTLLGYVQNEKPRLRADDGWPERHTQRLRRRLRIQDAEACTFLIHLAFRIGWVFKGETGRLRLTPEAVTAWLQSTPFDQRCAMAEAWRDDPTWNDLFHVPALQPEDTGAWRNDPLLARSAALRHLQACDPGTWYRLEHFVAAIKDVDADFQRPDGDYDAWYIRDAETGLYLSGFESWDAVEGRLIRHLLRRPIAWLGLIELGADAGDQSPALFRLTPGGGAFLELAEPPAPPEAVPARLRSGFRVTVPTARRYERFQLARVADWLQSGSPFVYRLTSSSLERAQRQGISVMRVLTFLGKLIEAPVPRAVEAALTRWAAQGAEAQLERAVLLRISSEELMDQVIASPTFGRLIQDRVGPTAATVREQDRERVIAALGELGLLPEVDGLP